MNLYWLWDALAASAWMMPLYALLGVSWALVLLPRRDWQRRAEVTALSIVLAPMWLTAWMFVLGTLGAWQERALIRPLPILVGALLVGGVGVLLAWRKRREPFEPIAHEPFNRFDRLLMLIIAFEVLVVWVVTAYWTFIAYDTLWVFGYQGRLYSLLGYIPNHIGYYPPFVSLQYALPQLVMGSMNDHHARVIVPLFFLGSVCAVYALGARALGRRGGLVASALWTFYPHVGEWAQMGDLEIPLTLTFTLASAYFLSAWQAQTPRDRRHYGLLSGVVFGVAMWTKPTAGAFVWGVMLAVGLAFVLTRGNWRAWLPRFEVAFWTGLACIPLGGVWYARNVLLGHNAVDFPHPSWLTLARRSGDLLGWGLLAAALAVALLWQTNAPRRLRLGALLGLGALLVGALPSMPFVDPTRYDPPQSALTMGEWAAVAIGALLLAGVLWRVFPALAPAQQKQARVVGWGIVLALPYYVTWFHAYSYHYRLSFAIVPLLILPSAALLVHLKLPARPLRVLAGSAVAAFAVWSALTPLTTAAASGVDWLWTDRYPDDEARYLVHNPSHVLVMQMLRGFRVEQEKEPIVIAPGEQRLPFFFPEMKIITDTTPTRLDELEGATHYLYTTFARWRYENDNGIPVSQNQIVSALGRNDIMLRKLRHADAAHRYELYELHLENRYQLPPDSPRKETREVLIGDFARYIGDYFIIHELYGNSIWCSFLFDVINETTHDYQLVFAYVNEATGEEVYRWEVPFNKNEHGDYLTSLWQKGEIVHSHQVFNTLHGEQVGNLIPSIPYQLHMSFYERGDPDKTPLTITVDGVPQTSYVHPATFTYRGLR